MKYSNELKVGISIVLAVLIFVFGVRYFQDMPLFRGSYELVTEFDEVSGLVSGNPVMISGVSVGDVMRISLDETGQEVQVRMRISKDVVIPEGSVVKQTGWSQLGGVQLVVEPGPLSNPRLEDGDYIPSRRSPGVLGNITEQAGPIVNRVDSLLKQLDITAEEVERQLAQPESNLNLTLANLQAITSSLERILQNEEGNVNEILTNTRMVTQDLRGFTQENTDDLAATVQRLNTATTRLDSALNTYNQLGHRLNSVAEGIEQGEGTLGHLAEDPQLYNRVDSLVINLNQLITDFQQNPGRYLRHVRGIDLF